MNTAKMHILLGYDFSESANLALSHAVKLALRLGARLHVSYVAWGDGFVADTNLGLNVPAEFPEAKEARTRLQRLLSEFGSDVDAEVHVRLNMAAYDGLMNLIKDLKPDLVIVGSNGKGALKRALLGSVSNLLAQRSPVPVMIIPAPGREQTLDVPAAPPEPELPAVGRAVANSDGASVAVGIAGVGGNDVVLR